MAAPAKPSNVVDFSSYGRSRSGLAQSGYATQGSSALARNPHAAAAAKAKAQGAAGKSNVVQLFKNGRSPASAPAQAARGAARATAGGAASSWKATATGGAVAGKGLAGAAALGLGLGLGNLIYEEILGRPWGPSLGDHLRRQEIESDAPKERYQIPGDPQQGLGGQSEGVEYQIRFTYARRSRSAELDEPVDYLEPDEWQTTFVGPVTSFQIEDLGFVRSSFGNDIHEYALVARNPSDFEYIRIPSNSGDTWTDRVTYHPRYKVDNVRFFKPDGTFDEPGTVPGEPKESLGTTPRTRSDPRPEFKPQPQRSPRAQPNKPETSPSSRPGFQPSRSPNSPAPSFAPGKAPGAYPADPFPNGRPQTKPDSSPKPALPPSFKGLPSWAPTPTSLLDALPLTQLAPRTTKNNNKCVCNGGILSAIGDLLRSLTDDSEKAEEAATVQADNNEAVLERLTKMQEYAVKAWTNTQLSKQIEVVTLASSLHNSAMLSRSVANTVALITNRIRDMIELKDETGKDLSLSALLKGSAGSFVESAVGEDVAADTDTDWHNSSRIVTAATALLASIRQMVLGTNDVVEWTAETIGKIGNALTRFNVVGSNAYPWFAERILAQDKFSGAARDVASGVTASDKALTSMSVVVADPTESSNEYSELSSQVNEFASLITEGDPGASDEKSPENGPIQRDESAKEENSQSPPVSIENSQVGE